MSDTPKDWNSQWNGGTAGKVFTYQVLSKSIIRIDSDMVNTIKEPLLRESNGKWSQGGMRYLRDRNNSVFGAVFTSNSIRDINDIWYHKSWQHTRNAKQLHSGMIVYVVPNDSLMKDAPDEGGIKFILDDQEA